PMFQYGESPSPTPLPLPSHAIMTAATSSPQSWWLALVIASLPAIAAIVAAILAARSARHTKAYEQEAQRVRDLENRISERKYEVYKPMIDHFRDILTRSADGKIATPSEEVTRSKIADFQSWISIYGSDEALRAFSNLMQGGYHAAPTSVILRL